MHFVGPARLFLILVWMPNEHHVEDWGHFLWKDTKNINDYHVANLNQICKPSWGLEVVELNGSFSSTGQMAFKSLIRSVEYAEP